MSEEVLKVSDIVDFSEKDYNNSKLIIKELDNRCKIYADLEDMATPEILEKLKREIGGYLNSLAVYYAKIRALKSANEYLHNERQNIKAVAIKLIMDRDKASSAAAEKLVYDEPYFTRRVNLMQDMKKYFYTVELKYGRYESTLRDIFQSVSLLSKERQYTQ